MNFRFVSKNLLRNFNRHIEYLKPYNKIKLYELMRKYNIPKRVILYPLCFSLATIDDIYDYIEFRSRMDRDMNSKKISRMLWLYCDLKNKGISHYKIKHVF